MTQPGRWEQNYGVNSPLAQTEWNEFLRSRDAFIQQLMGSHSIAQTGQPTIVPSPAMMQQQDPAPPDTELLGQAQAWGISEEAASQMPRDQLQALIEQFRRERRPADQAFGDARNLQAMFMLGAGEAVTGGLKRLPLVGDWFARNEALQKADTWLNMAEEAVRATMPNREQWIASTGEVGGQLAALWYPGMGAWNLAGKMGRLVPVVGALASPIIRGAAQGAISTLMLEGGGPRDQTVLLTDLGALLGVAGPMARPILEKVVPEIAMMRSRVSRAFGVGSRAEPVQLGPVQRISQYGEPIGPQMQSQYPAPIGPYPPGMEIPTQVLPEAEHNLLQVVNDPSMSQEARQSAQAMLDEFAQTRQRRGPPPAGGIPLARDVSGMELPTDISTQHLDELGVTLGQEAAVKEADNIAAQVSKQALASESSSLPDLARATNLDETSIAIATHIDNPGGTNVVPGIADPTKFASSLEKIPHVRFAQRGNRLDAITSDQPITDEMIGQYEKHGMFAGQVGYTQDGTSIRILDIQGGTARVKPLYGTTEVMMPVENVMPSPVSAGVIENPALYQDFQRYADQQLAEAQVAMGSQITPEIAGVMRTQNLNHWMDNFLDDIGFVQAGDRARVKQYFNERYVQDFAALAPDAQALQESARLHAMAAEFENPLTPIAALQEAAGTKGYLAIPDGQGGWNIANNVPDAFGTGGAVQIHFDTIEAAQGFVRKHHRPFADITPPGIVPAEVAEGLPHVGTNDPMLANAKVDADLDSAADDLVDAISREGDSALATDLAARIQEARASGKTGALRQVYDYGLARFQPMRNRMLTMERKIGEAGYPEVRPFKHFDGISTGGDKSHNWMNPHSSDWADITDVFDAKQTSSGRVTELWAIEDPVLRAQKAAESGFTPKQIAALDEMDRFFPNALTGENTNSLASWLGDKRFEGTDPTTMMKRLVTFIRTRQFADIPLNKRYAFAGGDASTAPVLDEIARAHIDLRELDAKQLGNIFLRSHGFHAFTRNAWDAAEADLKMLAKLGESRPGAADGEFSPVSAIMENWMKLVRHGYQPGADVGLDALHSVASFLIPGLTKAQTRSLFNAGLTNTHRALLGLRPDVMLRDSIQLFLALPRAGTDLLEVMGRYASGTSEIKSAMWERAIRKAGVQIGKPRIAQPGTFEDPLIYVENPEQAGAVGGLVQQPPVSKRYKMLQDVADWIHDKTPDSMRHITGTMADPLFFYTKQGERMRLFVFTAGDQRAARAIASYRQTGNLEKLMGESGARTYEPGVGKQFRDFIAAGNDDEAAAFMGRQLADATQFRYGIANTPEIGRSTIGKMGMQLGSFSTQFYQYAKESTRFGSAADISKFWGMMGTVYFGLKAAKHVTGWNFDKWQFHQSLVFTGGPWFGVAADLQQGVAALGQMAIRPDQSGGEYLAQEARTGLGQASRTIFGLDVPAQIGSTIQGAREAEGVGGVARSLLGSTASTAVQMVAGPGMLSPLGGLSRTIGAVAAAQESPTPGEATARALITGERNASQDWREMIGNHILQQPPIESLMQSSPPVRGNQMSMPVVPMTPTDTVPSGYPVARPSFSPDAVIAPQDSSRLRFLDALIAGQMNDQLDQEDKDFLNVLKPLLPQQRLDSWEMYQLNKETRRQPRPQGGGGGGGGGFQ